MAQSDDMFQWGLMVFFGGGFRWFPVVRSPEGGVAFRRDWLCVCNSLAKEDGIADLRGTRSFGACVRLETLIRILFP
jgi:hypothetical protein